MNHSESARAEAIANADAHLSNVSLPAYSELMEFLDSVALPTYSELMEFLATLTAKVGFKRLRESTTPGQAKLTVAEIVACQMDAYEMLLTLKLLMQGHTFVVKDAESPAESSDKKAEAQE